MSYSYVAAAVDSKRTCLSLSDLPMVRRSGAIVTVVKYFESLEECTKYLYGTPYTEWGSYYPSIYQEPPSYGGGAEPRYTGPKTVSVTDEIVIDRSIVVSPTAFAPDVWVEDELRWDLSGYLKGRVRLKSARFVFDITKTVENGLTHVMYVSFNGRYVQPSVKPSTSQFYQALEGVSGIRPVVGRYEYDVTDMVSFGLNTAKIFFKSAGAFLPVLPVHAFVVDRPRLVVSYDLTYYENEDPSSIINNIRNSVKGDTESQIPIKGGDAVNGNGGVKVSGTDPWTMVAKIMDYLPLVLVFVLIISIIGMLRR